MKEMLASELVIDFDMYPRNNVDAHNVKNLVDALSAGAELPPLIADRKTKRVVDGVHRLRAYIRLYGPDCKVPVVLKDYKTDQTLFLDAVRYNACHGAKLDPCDRTKCTIVAERLSIPLDAIAGALNMPSDKLGALKADRTARGAGGLSVPIKQTVRAFAGKKLNARQVQANEKLSGMNQQFYANQLIELIESDMLDKENERLVERLRKLHELLSDVLAAV